MSSFCIHVLNVGHGDSIILELPDNNWGLVDCFKTNAGIEPPALTFLKKRQVDRLTFVCLTHPHHDHYHGMLEILEYFSSEGRGIEYFLDSGISDRRLQYYIKEFGKKEYNEYKELRLLYDFVQEKITKDRTIKYLIAGEKTLCLDLGLIKINSYAPISSDILRYFEKWGEDKTIDENLLSVVLVITFRDTNIILGADTISWEEILNAWSEDCQNTGRQPKFNLVKVSHHGSESGNHEGLWDSFTLRGQSVAVISTGCRYDSPHPKTVKSIISREVKLYSTNFRDFSKPVSGNRLDEYVQQGLINQSLLEALDASTLPVEDFEIIAPYHGNCSITVEDNCECSFLPEIDRPPIS